MAERYDNQDSEVPGNRNLKEIEKIRDKASYLGQVKTMPDQEVLVASRASLSSQMQTPGGSGSAERFCSVLEQKQQSRGQKDEVAQRHRFPMIRWFRKRDFPNREVCSQDGGVGPDSRDMALRGDKGLRKSRPSLRFSTMSQRDKQMFKAQMSILFPCVFKRPSLQALQRALSDMKDHVIDTIGKMSLVEQNPALTESLVQRTTFRREVMGEVAGEGGACCSGNVDSGLVPISQKKNSSLSMGTKVEQKSEQSSSSRQEGESDYRHEPSSKSWPRTSVDCGGTGDQESTASVEKRAVGFDFEQKPENWRYNLMAESASRFAERDGHVWSVAQAALGPVHECPTPDDLKQAYCHQGFSIPGWFTAFLDSGGVLELDPTVPAGLMIRSEEVKSLVQASRRLVVQAVSNRQCGEGNHVGVYVTVTELEESTRHVIRDRPLTPVRPADGIALYDTTGNAGVGPRRDEAPGQRSPSKYEKDEDQSTDGNVSEDSGILNSPSTFFPAERKLSFRHSWKWFDKPPIAGKRGTKSGQRTKRQKLRRCRNRSKKLRALVMEIRHGVLFEGPARILHGQTNKRQWGKWLPRAITSGKLSQITPTAPDIQLPTRRLPTDTCKRGNVSTGPSIWSNAAHVSTNGIDNIVTCPENEIMKKYDSIIHTSTYRDRPQKVLESKTKALQKKRCKSRTPQPCPEDRILPDKGTRDFPEGSGATGHVDMAKCVAVSELRGQSSSMQKSERKKEAKRILLRRRKMGGGNIFSPLNKSNSSLPPRSDISELSICQDDEVIAVDELHSVSDEEKHSFMQVSGDSCARNGDRKTQCRRRFSADPNRKLNSSISEQSFFDDNSFGSESPMRFCPESLAMSTHSDKVLEEDTSPSMTPCQAFVAAPLLPSVSDCSSSTVTSLAPRQGGETNSSASLRRIRAKRFPVSQSLTNFVREQWRMIKQSEPSHTTPLRRPPTSPSSASAECLPRTSDELNGHLNSRPSPSRPRKSRARHHTHCTGVRPKSESPIKRQGKETGDATVHQHKAFLSGGNGISAEYIRQVIQRIMDRKTPESPCSDQLMKSPKSHVSFSNKDTIIGDGIYLDSRKESSPKSCQDLNLWARPELDHNVPSSILKTSITRIPSEHDGVVVRGNNIVRSTFTPASSSPTLVNAHDRCESLSGRSRDVDDGRGAGGMRQSLCELNQTWSNLSQDATLSPSADLGEESTSPPRTHRSRSPDSKSGGSSGKRAETHEASREESESTEEVKVAAQIAADDRATVSRRHSKSSRQAPGASSQADAQQQTSSPNKSSNGRTSPARKSRTRRHSGRDVTGDNSQGRQSRRSRLSADLRNLEEIIESWLSTSPPINRDRREQWGEQETTSVPERSELPERNDTRPQPDNGERRSVQIDGPKSVQCSCKKSSKRSLHSSEDEDSAPKPKQNSRLHRCSCKEPKEDTSDESTPLTEPQDRVRPYKCSCQEWKGREDGRQEETELERRQRVFEDALLGYRYARSAASYRPSEREQLPAQRGQPPCTPANAWGTDPSVDHQQRKRDERHRPCSSFPPGHGMSTPLCEPGNGVRKQARYGISEHTYGYDSTDSFKREDTYGQCSSRQCRTCATHQFNDLPHPQGSRAGRNPCPCRREQPCPPEERLRDTGTHPHSCDEHKCARPQSCIPCVRQEPPECPQSVKPSQHVSRACSCDQVNSSANLTTSQMEALAYINYVCNSGRVDPKTVAHFSMGCARSPEGKTFLQDRPRAEADTRPLDPSKRFTNPNVLLDRGVGVDKSVDRESRVANISTETDVIEEAHSVYSTNNTRKAAGPLIIQQRIEVSRPETSCKSLQVSLKESEKPRSGNNLELQNEYTETDQTALCPCCHKPAVAKHPHENNPKRDRSTAFEGQEQPNRTNRFMKARESNHPQNAEVQCSMAKENRFQNVKVQCCLHKDKSALDCNKYAQVRGTKVHKPSRRLCINKKCQIGSPMKRSKKSAERRVPDCAMEMPQACVCACACVGQHLGASEVPFAPPPSPCHGMSHHRVARNSPCHHRDKCSNRSDEFTMGNAQHQIHATPDSLCPVRGHYRHTEEERTGYLPPAGRSHVVDNGAVHIQNSAPVETKEVPSTDISTDQGSTLDACYLDVDPDHPDRSPIVHIRYRSRPVPAAPHTLTNKESDFATPGTVTKNGTTPAEIKASLKRHIAEILQQTREIQRTAQELHISRREDKTPGQGRALDKTYSNCRDRSFNHNCNANSFESDSLPMGSAQLKPTNPLTKSAGSTSATVKVVCQGQDSVENTSTKPLTTSKPRVQFTLHRRDARIELTASFENRLETCANVRHVKNIHRDNRDKSSNARPVPRGNASSPLMSKSTPKSQPKAPITSLDTYEETQQYLRDHAEELSRPYQTKHRIVQLTEVAEKDTSALKSMQVGTGFKASPQRTQRKVPFCPTNPCPKPRVLDVRDNCVKIEPGEVVKSRQFKDDPQLDSQANYLVPCGKKQTIQMDSTTAKPVKFSYFYKDVDQFRFTPSCLDTGTRGQESSTDLGFSLIVNDSKASSHGIEDLPLDTVSSDKSTCLGAYAAKLHHRSGMIGQCSLTDENSTTGNRRKEEKLCKIRDQVTMFPQTKSSSIVSNVSSLWTKATHDSSTVSSEKYHRELPVGTKRYMESSVSGSSVTSTEHRPQTSSTLSTLSDKRSDHGSATSCSLSTSRLSSSVVSQNRVLTPTTQRVRECTAVPVCVPETERKPSRELDTNSKPSGAGASRDQDVSLFQSGLVQWWNSGDCLKQRKMLQQLTAMRDDCIDRNSLLDLFKDSGEGDKPGLSKKVRRNHIMLNPRVVSAVLGSPPDKCMLDDEIEKELSSPQTLLSGEAVEDIVPTRDRSSRLDIRRPLPAIKDKGSAAKPRRSRKRNSIRKEQKQERSTSTKQELKGRGEASGEPGAEADKINISEPSIGEEKIVAVAELNIQNHTHTKKVKEDKCLSTTKHATLSSKQREGVEGATVLEPEEAQKTQPSPTPKRSVPNPQTKPSAELNDSTPVRSTRRSPGLSHSWSPCRLSMGHVVSSNESRVVIDGVHSVPRLPKKSPMDNNVCSTTNQPSQDSALSGEEEFPKDVKSLSFRIVLFRSQETSADDKPNVSGSYMCDMNTVNRYFKWRVRGIYEVNQVKVH